MQPCRRAQAPDRPFSLRQQFADAWYDLHNPDQTASPMTVRFDTRREDFPPNLDTLRIERVVLCFARAADRSFEVQNAELRFARAGTDDCGRRQRNIARQSSSTRQGNVHRLAARCSTRTPEFRDSGSSPCRTHSR